MILKLLEQATKDAAHQGTTQVPEIPPMEWEVKTQKNTGTEASYMQTGRGGKEPLKVAWGHDTLKIKIKAGNFQGMFQENMIKAKKPSIPEYFLHRMSIQKQNKPNQTLRRNWQKEGTSKKIRRSIASSTSHASALNCSYSWSVSFTWGICWGNLSPRDCM